MKVLLSVVLLLSTLSPTAQAAVRLPARVLNSPASAVRTPVAVVPALPQAPALKPALPFAAPTVSLPPALPAAPAIKPAIPLSAAVPAPERGAASSASRGTGDSLHAVHGRPNKLKVRFRELAAHFSGGRDPSGTAAPSGDPIAAIRGNLRRELESMAREIDGPGILPLVESEMEPLLDQIEGHLRDGAIDPSVRLRLSAEEPEVPPVDREVRAGFYPVSADPFHWGHLLSAWRAAAVHKLDKVVFVLAGDDPRKPQMVAAALRHPIGQAVLSLYQPFFVFSPIAVGTDFDGETNLFRFLALNARQRIHAYYMVGDDHYALKDKKDNPDTLPKIENNMVDPRLGFVPGLHKISVAFIERLGRGADVPTSLDVPEFLPPVPFDASSTAIRGGKKELMPFTAYDLARRQGLYGLTSPPPGQ